MCLGGLICGDISFPRRGDFSAIGRETFTNPSGQVGVEDRDVGDADVVVEDEASCANIPAGSSCALKITAPSLGARDAAPDV